MLRPTTIACLLAVTATSQNQAPWAVLNVPTGVVAAQATSQGKLVVYRDGGLTHVWSAVTRQWSSTAASSSATLRLNNDCLLLQDAGTWTAWSAYRGRFEPLPVGASATLLNATGAINDSVLLVADAGQLHAFSAFVGTWVSRPLATNYQAAVQRHVAVLTQGTVLSGLVATTGVWHDHTAAIAPTIVSADGTAGFAFGAGTIHAFSASHGAWHDTGEPPGATFSRADDWGLWSAGQRLLGYSSLRNTFDHTDGPVLATVATQDVFVMVDAPRGLLAFSALTGSFSGPLAASGTTVSSSTAVALLNAAGGALGYSAVHNRTALRPNVGANAGAANVVAWASSATGGPPWFFSALTCQWYQGPATMLPGDPTLTTTSAASSTSTGCLAFEPRTGRFVPLLDPTVSLVGSPSSAPLLAIGTTALHAFDPRLGQWRSTPRLTPGIPNPQIWRTGAVVIDGTTAHGFGVQAGDWSSVALTGPVTSLRANSESVRVATPNDVFAWSALGEVGWFAQFPEFRRVQPVGSMPQLVARVPQNGVAILAFGRLAAAPLPLAGLGDLLLVPNTLATLPVAASPTGEPVVVTLPSVPTPARLGDELAVQAAVFSLGGNPYLTDVATLMPF